MRNEFVNLVEKTLNESNNASIVAIIKNDVVVKLLDIDKQYSELNRHINADVIEKVRHGETFVKKPEDAVEGDMSHVYTFRLATSEDLDLIIVLKAIEVQDDENFINLITPLNPERDGTQEDLRYKFNTITDFNQVMDYLGTIKSLKLGVDYL